MRFSEATTQLPYVQLVQLVYSIQYFGYSLAQLSQLIQLRRSLYMVAAYSQLIRLEYKGWRRCQILDNSVNSLR